MANDTHDTNGAAPSRTHPGTVEALPVSSRAHGRSDSTVPMQQSHRRSNVAIDD